MHSLDRTVSGAGVREEWREQRLAVRSGVEWTLRCISIITLALLIWQAVHALRARPGAWARGHDIRPALTSWSTRESPYHAHVVFDSTPTPVVRDWVAALPGAGTETSWDGSGLKPTAVSVEPVADPKHPARVWFAAPNGSAGVLHDEVGTVDSVVTRRGGAVVTVPHLQGEARVSVDGTTASAVLQDSLTIKPILVLGVASWEGKFVMAALEEYGWQVDARFDVSPKVTGVVIQGPAELQIDTAHYSAVIALDTSAAKYAGQISTFVHSGGGFIAEGAAASSATFAALMPGALGEQLPPTVTLADTTHPRSAFALAPITQLKPAAVAVEDRANEGTAAVRIAVAAVRSGAGRVLQIGYSNTWHWRMGGKDGDPVRAYEKWWSAMVSSVAYAQRTPLASMTVTEPTPLASLVATLGAARAEAKPRIGLLDDPRFLPAAFALLMAALLAEWASRRLRGMS